MTKLNITLKSITNNPEIDETYNRIHPVIDQHLVELNAALVGHAVPFQIRFFRFGRER